jgi:hypothetical protein
MSWLCVWEHCKFEIVITFSFSTNWRWIRYLFCMPVSSSVNHQITRWSVGVIIPLALKICHAQISISSTVCYRWVINYQFFLCTYNIVLYSGKNRWDNKSCFKNCVVLQPCYFTGGFWKCKCHSLNYFGQILITNGLLDISWVDLIYHQN